MMHPAPSKYQKSNIKNQIFFYFLFAICCLIFNISLASAQTQNPQMNQPQPAYQVNPYLNPTTNPDVPKNQHTWVQTVMIDVMSAMACQLTGIDPTNPKGKCLGVDPKTGNIGFIEGGGGAIGVAGKMIAMLYTPPLNTADYFKYLADNFGIAKKVHAQATKGGFEGLKPIQSLWIALRDIVYLLFVIIFVIIGVAIMLRVRIDPRTVMTIQNQIPRIIIGILLLTFSFAIAGFLIDLMYVFIFLSYEVISGAVSSTTDLTDLNPLGLKMATPFDAADKISNFGQPGLGLAEITFEAAKAIGEGVAKLFGSFLGATAGLFFSNSIIKNIFQGALGFVFGPPGIVAFIADKVFGVGIFDAIFKGFGIGVNVALSNVIGFLASLIAYLIIAVALGFSLLRLWFVLIITYVAILIDVVFAPFWIAASLLPGSPIGFGAWLRSIISNLAAYPATIIMFLLAKIFIDSFGACKLPDCDPATAFVPPLIGRLPGTDAIGAIIGLGIIIMTPGVVSMVKQAFRAPAPSAAPIMTALGVATATPSEVLRFGAYLGGTLYGLAHLPIIGRLGFFQRIRGAGPGPIPGRP